MKAILSIIVIIFVVSMAIFFMALFLNKNNSSEAATPDIGLEAYLSPATTQTAGINQAFILPVSDPSYIPILNSNIPRPNVGAKAAIVYNVRSSKFLYQENIRHQLPIASLTKIMTATVVLERLDLKETVTVDEKSLKVDGVKQELYLNEQISVENLLKMMLVSSSNDAAYALSAHARTKGIDMVSAMNEKARTIGMHATLFKDPAGLDDTGYSTTYDLIKLVQATALYREIWISLTEKEILVRSVDGEIVHTVTNTDELLGVIPNIIGGKTGFTDGAQGCLILIVSLPEYNDTIISVVLGSRDRFGDTQKIVEWIKTAYRWE